MTGMNQWHTGILGMGGGQGPIPNDFPHTLAGELTRTGYRTHLIGKGHFTPQRAKMGFESHELDESGRMLRHGQKDEYRTWFDAEKQRDITPDDPRCRLEFLGFSSLAHRGVSASNIMDDEPCDSVPRSTG